MERALEQWSHKIGSSSCSVIHCMCDLIKNHLISVDLGIHIREI